MQNATATPTPAPRRANGASKPPVLAAVPAQLEAPPESGPISSPQPQPVVIPGRQIYAAMAAILAEVDAITKDRQCTQPGANFAYRGVDDVYNSLHGTFAKHGVFLVSKLLKERSEERTTRSGTAMIRSVVEVEWTFYAADGSSVAAIAPGEAADAGDKSLGKAMQYSLKQCLLQTFLIPTQGEDKDPDSAAPTWGDPRAARGGDPRQDRRQGQQQEGRQGGQGGQRQQGQGQQQGQRQQGQPQGNKQGQPASNNDAQAQVKAMIQALRDSLGKIRSLAEFDGWTRANHAKLEQIRGISERSGAYMSDLIKKRRTEVEQAELDQSQRHGHA